MRSATRKRRRDVQSGHELAASPICDPSAVAHVRAELLTYEILPFGKPVSLLTDDQVQGAVTVGVASLVWKVAVCSAQRERETERKRAEREVREGGCGVI
ncbi:unnamed protein product, partial [Iphiclides podalirius]